MQPVNRGRATARNRALAAADADAFLFLDHDDLFHPEHVRLCLEALRSHPRVDYVETGVDLSDPVHCDWTPRIAASLTQNLCVRARCHRLIGGFHEEPEVEAYGCDDALYNRTLHALFHGVRVPSATVRFNRRAGNSFDRQYERKFSRPVGDARPTTSAAQRELADEMIALQERRQAEVRRRLGGALSRKHPTLRFPPWEAGAGEDSAYLHALKQTWSWYPWRNPPELMVRMFHGANTQGARHFGMSERPAGTWRLPRRSAEVLHRVLELYRDQGVPVPRGTTPRPSGPHVLEKFVPPRT